MKEEENAEQGLFTDDDLPEHPEYIKQFKTKMPDTKFTRHKQKQRMRNVKE